MDFHPSTIHELGEMLLVLDDSTEYPIGLGELRFDSDIDRVPSPMDWGTFCERS